jgi:acyl-CoA synthetase (AMP-forming)/AMP-acid ligase II
MPSPDYAPTFPNMLRHIAAEYGNSEALLRGADRLTFAALERQSADLARGLLAMGAGKGSRIGILMAASPDFALAFMAGARIGAVLVPFSTLLPAPELRKLLCHDDVDTLLMHPAYLHHDYLARLEQAFPALAAQRDTRLFLPEAPYLRSVHVWGRSVETCDRTWAHRGKAALLTAAAGAPAIDDAFLRRVEAQVTPADPALIVNTSGSTAEPKAVVHTHGSAVRASQLLSVGYRRMQPGMRLISNRVFFWVAGLNATMLYSLHDGTCLVIPETGSAAEIAELIERENVDAFVGTLGVPDIIKAVQARNPDRNLIRIHQEVYGVATRKNAGSPWRFVSDVLESRTPAATLPPPVERIPNGYGMTETFGSHSFDAVPAPLPAGKDGACGLPVAGVEQRLVHPDTGEDVAPGEPGELWIRGMPLMAGLYKRERGETFTPDNWYRTGDLCTKDADGYLTFKGRLGDMVKISGANVAPAEVELCLVAEPGVREVVVMGVPDAHDAITLVAAIVPGVELVQDEEQIRARLRTQLSSYKVPRRIVFLEAEQLPRIASGKVNKPKLREVLAAAIADRQ